jgi:hypothetical protein
MKNSTPFLNLHHTDCLNISFVEIFILTIHLWKMTVQIHSCIKTEFELYCQWTQPEIWLSTGYLVHIKLNTVIGLNFSFVAMKPFNE